MNVTLKPFDFAQAVARAGLGTDGVPLAKAAVLDLSVGEDVTPPGTRLALYTAGADGVWRRVGGTLDPAGARITTSFSGAGEYALFGAPPRSPDLTVPLGD